MDNPLIHLCRRLSYTFVDPSLLKRALTHCSAGTPNNERYEFLGDSILSMVIANALLTYFPHQTEGELSRLRAHLVNGEMLASIALEIDLGNALYLGQGELKSGGFRRASILADALEAVFAAIFLDGGFEASQHSILHLYASRLNEPSLQDNLKDAKTQLQEFVQQKKYPLPRYHLTHVKGEEHDQTFHISCTIGTLKTTGAGETRRKAEQRAARALLTELKASNRIP